jgi:hypothetical protein
MREKYIFFILTAVIFGLLIGAVTGKKEEGEITAEELAVRRKLDLASQEKLILPERIDITAIQDLASFSAYEGMLKRSPFARFESKIGKAARVEKELPSAVEDQTPQFIYKGRIASGNKLVVIIEQTRSGEVVMVSQGQGVDGYKVLDISDTEVILSKKGEENIVLKTKDETDY